MQFFTTLLKCGVSVIISVFYVINSVLFVNLYISVSLQVYYILWPVRFFQKNGPLFILGKKFLSSWKILTKGSCWQDLLISGVCDFSLVFSTSKNTSCLCPLPGTLAEGALCRYAVSYFSLFFISTSSDITSPNPYIIEDTTSVENILMRNAVNEKFDSDII